MLTIFPPALSPDMAEDEVTPEQLAAIAAENEEPEPVNYKPPAQKSVKEIHDLDKDDESLRKYKEALLGSGISESGKAFCALKLTYKVSSIVKRLIFGSVVKVRVRVNLQEMIVSLPKSDLCQHYLFIVVSY